VTPNRLRQSHNLRVQRRATVLALGAAVVLLILLGHAYVQQPALIFAAATLSGLWVGIASLFSP